MNLYRGIDSIPVFAKAGAVIPFQEDYMENAGENPKKIHLYVYVGADGSFTMYEDDNFSNAYRDGDCVKTPYEWREEEGCLRIGKVQGNPELIPEKRDYIITFCGLTDADVSAADGRAVFAGRDRRGMLEVVAENVPVQEETILYLKEREEAKNDTVGRCFELLNNAEIEMLVKENAFRVIKAQEDAAQLMGSLLALDLDVDLYGALAEIITA